jgi:hypothetical protein
VESDFSRRVRLGAEHAIGIIHDSAFISVIFAYAGAERMGSLKIMAEFMRDGANKT